MATHFVVLGCSRIPGRARGAAFSACREGDSVCVCVCVCVCVVGEAVACTREPGLGALHARGAAYVG